MTTETAEPATTPAYKIAEYNPVAASLAELRQRFAGVAYDLTTTKGDREARQARKELVTLRTSLEAKRKELKAPALERSRLIDAEARVITDAILELETPIDEQIKADEQRRENERQAKAKAEADRVDAIQKRIGLYGWFIFRASGQPSNEIRALIDELRATPPNASFEEFQPAARAAYDNAWHSLDTLLARAVAQEAEAQRLAEERVLLALEAARLAQARAQEEARAAAARKAEEDRQRAEQAARDALFKAEREAEEALRQRQREEEEARLAEIRRQQEEGLQRQREQEAARLAEERRIAEEAAAAERQRIAEAQAELDRRKAAQEAEERRAREEREAAEAQARAEQERRDAEERELKMAEQRAEMERAGRLHGAAERMLQALLAVRLHVMAWEDGTLADGDQLAQYVGDEVEPAIAAATAMPGTPPAAVMAELPNGE